LAGAAGRSGSGCIGVSVLRKIPNAIAWARDDSAEFDVWSSCAIV
jgi:hypothetical protein